MYIYYALINALNAHNHIMHINLNIVFCTHVEDSPTEMVYIRHYMDIHPHTHTHMCSHTHTYTHSMAMTVAEMGVSY